MIRAAVLADDATGALELGALFAAAGIATAVSLDAERAVYGVDAVVVDTETRHLDPAQARQRVAAVARRLPVADLYKKTDSTLRGNIGAEFDGLLDVYPSRPLLYVPAYPRLGRTVLDGVLLVNGRPVSATEFADDPVDPVRESHVPTLLARQTSRPTVRWPGGPVEPGTIVVCDGTSDEDLRAMAEYVGGAIAAGPGGFARHWIEHLSLPRGKAPTLPPIQSLLVVCGSLHPVSRLQAERARSTPGVQVLVTHEPGPAAAALHAGTFDAIAVFGGDTAFGLLQALGHREVTPLGEVLPGVPASAIFREGRRLALITKAGGFGEENLIQSVMERMKSTA